MFCLNDEKLHNSKLMLALFLLINNLKMIIIINNYIQHWRSSYKFKNLNWNQISRKFLSTLCMLQTDHFFLIYSRSFNPSFSNFFFVCFCFVPLKIILSGFFSVDFLFVFDKIFNFTFTLNKFKYSDSWIDSNVFGLLEFPDDKFNAKYCEIL